jgi:DNA-binding LacI/PurR family transcriptional regulator
MAAVHEAGLCVPHDFSIVGFDNTELSAYLSPTLSTVDLPGEEMGRLGMEALLTLVFDKKHPPIQKTLPTSLIFRASTCPADRQKQW